MDSGESLKYKNAQGKTPLDCTPHQSSHCNTKCERRWSDGLKHLNNLLLLSVISLCSATKRALNIITV
ncbi:hypothetical protein GLYMA_13G116150v4 [Glycine max]|nr:hypothetical protein GLYMA_13G116150v4 [Glycine max]KAG4383575.1 hypothetical protein GLYMA_13G116150v4 [Glycine max]KAG4383576.1 hypothetical protein GLYMA_13G116150v4 [Glycine max]KAH1100992.1 hypothetical protein GYH30_035888 [Glycine max]KAH1100993.1 hypothetical protein GYH30_035888 [Glycine max]